jgi:hypothetical protein
MLTRKSNKGVDVSADRFDHIDTRSVPSHGDAVLINFLRGGKALEVTQ